MGLYSTVREIFVLFRAWHGTIDSGLFTKRRNLRYSKTRIAYYSNSTATQALLLSQEKAASTNNNLPRSKPTAAKCDLCQKTIRWNQKNISCANCMGCFHLKCMYLKSMVNNQLCNRCTWARPCYSTSVRMLKCSPRPVFRILIICLTQLIITVTDQRENGIIPNTFAGPDLLVYFSQLSDLNTVQRQKRKTFCINSNLELANKQSENPIG